MEHLETCRVFFVLFENRKLFSGTGEATGTGGTEQAIDLIKLRESFCKCATSKSSCWILSVPFASDGP